MSSRHQASLYTCHGWQALPSFDTGTQDSRKCNYLHRITWLMMVEESTLASSCMVLASRIERVSAAGSPCPCSSWLLYRLQHALLRESPALPICAILAVASSVATGRHFTCSIDLQRPMLAQHAIRPHAFLSIPTDLTLDILPEDRAYPAKAESCSAA